VALQLIVDLVKEAFDRGFFEGPVHALDPAIVTGELGFGQS